MENTPNTPKAIFSQMRKLTKPYMDERGFQLSNAQLFLFLSNAPAALAIAGDGEVDETEISAIEYLAKSINVDTSVSLELQEQMALAGEPDDNIINQEFNIRVGAELLYLSRNIQKYEKDLIQAVKTMLLLDASLKSAISQLMDMVVEDNLSKNKEEETKKMNKIKTEIGLI